MKKQTSMPAIILASVIVVASLCQMPAYAQDDAFARLKAIARMQDTLKNRLPKVTITEDNPIWKPVSGKPIPYKPIPMVDKNGKTVPGNQMITLPSGRQITAAEYIKRLNEMERKLNARGYSIRDSKNRVVSRIITPKADLDGRIKSTRKAAGKLKTADESTRFTDPNITTGGKVLKPLGDYTSAERKKVQSTVIRNINNSNYKVAKIKAPVKSNRIHLGPWLLKTIDETTTRDQHFGNASTFLAGVNVSFTRFAKIYGSDPQRPNTNISEYKVSGKGRIYASLLDHSFDVLTASGEFYVPADSSKKMNARLVVVLGGFNILNLDEKYDQRKEVHGIKARDSDISLPISITIVPAILNFTGLIGVKGTIGFEYKGSLDRTFLKGELKPFASLSGYGEAGIGDPYDIAGLGIGGELTFLNGNVDLVAWFGLYNQNSSQLVFGYGYDVSYYLEFLSGRLYAYGRLCDPFFGYCWTEETDIFTWPGFKDFGTYADGRNLFFINDLPPARTAVFVSGTK